MVEDMTYLAFLGAFGKRKEVGKQSSATLTFWLMQIVMGDLRLLRLRHARCYAHGVSCRIDGLVHDVMFKRAIQHSLKALG